MARRASDAFTGRHRRVTRAENDRDCNRHAVPGKIPTPNIPRPSFIDKPARGGLPPPWLARVHGPSSTPPKRQSPGNLPNCTRTVSEPRASKTRNDIRRDEGRIPRHTHWSNNSFYGNTVGEGGRRRGDIGGRRAAWDSIFCQKFSVADFEPINQTDRSGMSPSGSPYRDSLAYRVRRLA